MIIGRFPAALALALLASSLAPRAASAATPFGARVPAGEPEALPPLSRDYESTDLLSAQRLAITALQDLGFALESADAETGSLTASRLDSFALRLTITLSAANESTITASVAADYAGAPIADARPAEAFFAALANQLAPPPAID
jgi:hypothetical protein